MPRLHLNSCRFPWIWPLRQRSILAAAEDNQTKSGHGSVPCCQIEARFVATHAFVLTSAHVTVVVDIDNDGFHPHTHMCHTWLACACMHRSPDSHHAFGPCISPQCSSHIHTCGMLRGHFCQCCQGLTTWIVPQMAHLTSIVNPPRFHMLALDTDVHESSSESLYCVWRSALYTSDRSAHLLPFRP